MKLISISGAKRSGKNLFANIIFNYEARLLSPLNPATPETTGLLVKQGAFADPLKDEVAALLTMHFADVPGLVNWCMNNLGDEGINAYNQMVGVGNETPYPAYDLIDWEDYNSLRRTLDDDVLKDVFFRKFLQLYGTEYRRERDQDYWLDRAFVRHEKAREQGYDVCLWTDTRFPNEIAFMRDAHATLVKVVRPSLEENDGHASENALKDVPLSVYDAVFYNDGTMEEFEAKVLDWWKEVRNA